MKGKGVDRRRKMNITVAGTGYVGLVTGVCLAEVGYNVVCLDVDEDKITKLQQGQSPIYEPGIEDLIQKNMGEGRLSFTTNEKEAYSKADIIFIAVGTPENEDGSANLTYIQETAMAIAKYIEKDVIVVIKSTVPVGTNDQINHIIQSRKPPFLRVSVVSNPEFLREGSAIYDMFHGDRIVIGASDEKSADTIAALYEPFGIPIMKTDTYSAEMIKYASNAFLATKISFINEIANICEKVGANIDEVAYGIGLDKRIGLKFLRAGIGYGGSCFPKDTKALVQIAGNVEYRFELLEAVIKINNKQQTLLVEKAKQYFGCLRGKKVALLGLAFKPNTDDIREAASIVIAKKLIAEGAEVIAYDPIAMDNAKKVLKSSIKYAKTVIDALRDAEAAFIVTEWDEFKKLPLSTFKQYMRAPVIFDGRNCFSIDDVEGNGLTYISIGRPSVYANDQ
jgi:UDPglucose 6-dehydrogenase